ncbi:hypothetical protein BURMUCF1_B0266 [Burkholderia multivorans ATCC BAA-247]|nr:hypothetical protein BURMUCF1_B0266 [Burkholderia multivorans ATCC BAA-247]
MRSSFLSCHWYCESTACHAFERADADRPREAAGNVNRRVADQGYVSE